MVAAVLTLAWLLLGAVQDWRCREVSHSLVVPALLFGLLWRVLGLAEGTWLEVICILILLAMGFQWRWVGGADVKATLGIALVSVPLAMWAWAGLVLWAAFLHLWHEKGELARLPGFIGFFAGVAGRLLCQLLL